MIEHKTYECEYCHKEFDDDEYKLAIKHEAECLYNPAYKFCCSCKFAKIVSHYEVEYVQCTKPRDLYSRCDCWEAK